MPKTLVMVFLMMVGTAGVTRGTGQVPDRIILENAEYPLAYSPLEDYFRDRPRPVILKEGVHSSSCWRGYQALWQVRNDSLFLISVNKEYRVDPDSTWHTVWREVPIGSLINGAELPLFADWYSGILHIPTGKRMDWDAIAYAGRWESEIVCAVECGVVTDRAEVDHRYGDKFTSDADRVWVALGQPPREPGDFFDARLLGCREIALLFEPGDTVVTRGIIGTWRDTLLLDVPVSEAAGIFYCPLIADSSLELSDDFGDHVEMVTRVVNRDEPPLLEVLSVRKLRFGETIHSPEFETVVDRCPELLSRR